MSKLTPYDTGDRLEPKPWSIAHTEPGGSAEDRDRYGRVDFDNDESGTEFTVCAKRGDDGKAVLEIDLMAAEGNFTVIVDGVEYAPVLARAGLVSMMRDLNTDPSEDSEYLRGQLELVADILTDGEECLEALRAALLREVTAS